MCLEIFQSVILFNLLFIYLYLIVIFLPCSAIKLYVSRRKSLKNAEVLYLPSTFLSLQRLRRFAATESSRRSPDVERSLASK